jgi:hypothetical protein
VHHLRENDLEFHDAHGPIPDGHFDNEVPVKKNPDDCYSAEFVERQARRLKALLRIRTRI